MNALTQYIDPSLWGAMIQHGMTEMADPTFWVAVVKIMWINILLSGDNAVVIALACRALPPRQRMWGMIFGAGVAVVLRIVFTAVIAQLMLLPYLKLVGGLALLYIAAKLLVPENGDDGKVEAVDKLWRAIRIVAIADIIMSLDNVIAIAAAARNDWTLIIIGLGISIPLIVGGAAVIMALLDRYPILVWAGAGLLGWIAGEVIATDSAVLAWLNPAIAHTVEYTSAAVGVVVVLVVGGLWRRSKRAVETEV